MATGDGKPIATQDTSPLLKLLATIDVPAVPLFPYEKSRAFSFEADKGVDRGILWKGDDFEREILPIREENVPEITLTVYEITRDAKNFRIATELNLDDRGPLSLAHFYEVLSRQFYGEAGFLATDGTVHVAYIIGYYGNIWTVAAYLLKAGGWVVHAHPFGEYQYGWIEGTRFLSR